MGKVVSLTGTTVTVSVERGGADVGKNATYNLTAATRVRKDRTAVSTSGQVPGLASLGLKAGYYVTLMVDNGNVVSLQFNSDGSQTRGFGQGPGPGGAQGSGNGSAPAQ